MEDDDKKKNVNLPDELIIEILLFLPIKSLMQFRCVNKTWFQLLTNPDSYFAQSFLSKSNKNKTTILALRVEKQLEDKTRIYSAVELSLGCDKEANDLELPFCGLQTNSSYYVDGIRNGLILLRLADEKNKFFVLNPLTNDYIHLPSPPPPDHHPCDEITNTGFGFLQATNQYKIICFNHCKYGSRNSHVSVFTLGGTNNNSWSWRKLWEIPYHSFFSDSAAPILNGALHWTAFRDSSCLDLKRIVSFDLIDEVFREIPYPKNDDYHPNYYDRTGELGGLLCILGRDSGENVEVWVMKEYGVANSWTKQFTIRRPDINGRFNSLQPIGLAYNGEIIRITSILIKTDDLQPFLYNHETNSVRHLKEFGFRLYEAYAYTPTFISPRAIIGGGGLLTFRRAACTYTPSSLISPRPVNRGRELLLIRRAAYKQYGLRGLSEKNIRDLWKIQL